MIDKGTSAWKGFLEDQGYYDKRIDSSINNKGYIISNKLIIISDTWLYWVINEWLKEKIPSLGTYTLGMIYWKDQIETEYKRLKNEI